MVRTMPTYSLVLSCAFSWRLWLHKTMVSPRVELINHGSTVLVGQIGLSCNQTRTRAGRRRVGEVGSKWCRWGSGGGQSYPGDGGELAANSAHPSTRT